MWRRRKVVTSYRPSDDAKLDDELWQQTMAECEKGWISGPYMTEAEVSRVLESDEWLCTKRFPLRQGDKIRLIDDALASGINAAFSTFNKAQANGCGHFSLPDCSRHEVYGSSGRVSCSLVHREIIGLLCAPRLGVRTSIL